MSAHCNAFLDSEAEDDDRGSLKDFIDDSASNESSFAISEQHSPSTGDEKSMGIVEELVLQQKASPILAEDKSR
ncbi:hypothetical protein PGQ11_007724 [Apiospora arundinis]|uniref:Uncharacterized protein n=1 Tax=Apiospora arundinis TaxID=335852 RepID=A0ABR2IX12_9PEZI